MKKLFTSILLLFSLSCSIYAQQFAAPNMIIPIIHGNDTLTNAWSGGLNAPLFSEIDLNMDGIKDLFAFDFSNLRISTFINNGNTASNPFRYDPSYVGSFPPFNSWVKLYDYNCDGKDDFFTLSQGNNGIAIYQNTSTSTTGLQFTLVTNMLMEQYQTIMINVYANAVSLPAFSDIDNDGDMDILGYNTIPDGRIVYHRNYSKENFGICDSLKFKFESSAWGKFMMQVGGGNEVGCFNCRLATKTTTPALTQSEPKKSIYNFYRQSEAARIDDTVSSIFAIDLDGDTDKELLIGDIGAANTLMVLNGKTTGVDSMVSQDKLFPSYNVPVHLNAFTYHSYIDCDNDGKKDLLVSPTYLENRKCVWLYKNTGTNSSPVFNYVADSFLVSSMLDLGEGACPAFFDHNNDGLYDMVAGNYGLYDSSTHQYNRGLTLYENTGTLSKPAFKLITADYAATHALLLDGPVYPAFGDIDNDGDMDMLLGTGSGFLYLFGNAALPGKPAQFVLAQANYANIKVGNGAATPQLVDLNKDGLLDIVAGEQAGSIKYYQNTGTTSGPVFASAPTLSNLGGINLQTIGTTSGYTTPFFYEDNGQYYLWAACMRGAVYKYGNITGNLSGTFTLLDSLIYRDQGFRYSFNLAASGGDIDNDGIMDMAMGLYGGGIHIYTSNGPNSVNPLQRHNDEISLYPNPANKAITLHAKNLYAKGNTIEVYNQLSQRVDVQAVHAPDALLDVLHYAEGVYFIRYVTGSKTVIKKFVVCRE